MLQTQFLVAEETLDDLAIEINREHELFTDTMNDGVLHAIRVGELLIEAKNKVNHGEWIPWIVKNCDFTRRMAANYMRVAMRKAELNTNGKSISHLSDAIKLLAEPKRYDTTR